MTDPEPKILPDAPSRQDRDMDINLDRGRRFRATLGFWLLVIALALLLAYLLNEFIHSKVIAITFSAGMLLYMIIAGAITSNNLSRPPGDGRLD